MKNQDFYIINLEESTHLQIDISSICVLMSGSISLNYNEIVDVKIEEGDMAVFPAHQPLYIRCLTPSIVLINRLDINTYFSTELIGDLVGLKKTDEIAVLSMKDNIRSLFAVQYGLLCEDISDACKHILHSVCALASEYYTKADLLHFLSPALTQDLRFKNFIIQNCLTDRNLNTLALRANYSTSGFVKKFHRVFGIAPSTWIASFKAKRILHDIFNTSMLFSEIADKYSFSSPAYFYVFCKKHFGKSPSKLRKEVLKPRISKKTSRKVDFEN